MLFFILQTISAQPGKRIEKGADGLSIRLSDGTLNILPMAENAVRIRFYKDFPDSLPEFVFISKKKFTDYQKTETADQVEIKTSSMLIRVNKSNGSLSFQDNDGNVFLRELAGTRNLIARKENNQSVFLAEQQFESPADESLFGLGQFQDGQFNLKGIPRRLIQVNSQIALPFIYSSKGYGLLWHQYGLTDFNPTRNNVLLVKQESPGQVNNTMADATTSAGTRRIQQGQSGYSGQFEVPEDGEYAFFLDLGDMGNRQLLKIDSIAVIDQSNLWLPPSIGTKLFLKAGVHQAEISCKASNHPTLSWNRCTNTTTFRSPDASDLDYVVFYGPSADQVIQTYRDLSGNVPMLPEWAFGFWQCRERYTSGEELVNAVSEFRKRKLPLDVIVQDWQYWGNNGWGVPVFDTNKYKNPASFIKEIHDQHAHFNISVWSNPDRNSNLGKEFSQRNLFIKGTKWLDYFSPETRVAYWKTLNENLFSYGVDSWWMDATEPENDALKGETTYLGSGNSLRLLYPLMVCQSVFEGQRNTSSEKRVCILTRSAFLGQQRYASINWSGDIGGNWETYRRQIVAGLNYTVCGMPYWTTDIGGFFRPGQAQYSDENYKELLTRWFQWGAFNPVFRVHGYQSETEIWKYGTQLEENVRKTMNLRYRLLPYIYSEAWQISTHGYTLMRPLVMDFRNDSLAVSQEFEFMFGPSILVAPVIQPGNSEATVYLPKTIRWYDFYSGHSVKGGQKISVSAPLDQIPLFIKAGSILPLGRELQYAGENPADTLEIRIYQGADAQFDLYEDEGDNYNYEKGIYSLIPFSWNEQKHTLTIQDRKGDFNGCLNSRIFILSFYKQGDDPEKNSFMERKTISYSGKKLEITVE